MRLLQSLRVRLIGTYVALAILLLTGTGLVFSVAFMDYATRVHEQRMNEMIGQAMRVAQESQASPDQLAERLSRLFPELQIAYIPAIVSVRGLAPRSFRAPTPRIFLFRDGDEVTAVPALPVTVSGQVVGQLVFAPKSEQVPVFRTLYREMVILGVLGLGVAGVLGWWLSRWLSRPIAGIAQATAAVAEGDFLQTVPPTGTPELDSLVQQFNRMVERLNDSFRNLSAERDVAKRFASDAAHELKTPLTALKAYHETVLERPERLPQVLPGMGRQIDRIERIIAGLLQLARLSEGTGVTLEPADAAEAARSLEPGFRALVDDWEHQFAVTYAEGALPVRTDGRLLEIALTNLVENACKFTPADGHIGIHVAQEGDEAVIAVTDDGPGIPPDELPLIFERFHRAVGTQSIPGTGLGLSIVQEAVRRMGGRVSVETEVGKGSRFCIHLPLEKR